MFENRNLKLDLFALGLLAVVAFLAVSLATYDKADWPGATVYPAAEKLQNACGRGGAVASHFLLEGLGVGAYLLVVSLATWDLLLLLRRSANQPVLRGIGAVLAICGVSTLASMLLPDASPGPVIGAGGYLGAAGRGALEMHFATAGAYILTLSIIVAGVLLSTDYYLLRAAAHTAGFTARGLARISHTSVGSNEKPTGEQVEDEDEEDWDEEEDEEEDEYNEEEEDEYDEEEEESSPAIRIRGKSTSGKEVKGEQDEDEQLDEEEEEEEEEEEQDELDQDEDAGEEAEPEEEEEEPAKRGVRGRLASALRIKKPRGKKAREEVLEQVIDQLDGADQVEEPLDYELPSLDLLLEGDGFCFEDHEREVRRKAKILEKTFANFGFRVKVVEIETGPVIAQYEVELEAGLRLSKITGLADDLAIALRVPSVRIVAPIPGKNTVGIEVPNEHRQIVRLREVIEETNGRAKRMKIPVFLGKDVSGNPMVVDLATLPHLLIAGRTGTGKSVCLNSIIVSILMQRKPDEVRMLMIDPKMVELSPYKKLPHLMHPVVTDMRKAEAILAWAVDKMEERYALLARAGVRHVSVYNQLGEEELRERIEPENDEEWANIPRQLPFIVAVADEIADLMMTCGKDVEQHIIRLAQKSRAVGIHLILATQKPTVDVITGLIKSNLPARIAFQVASRTDSRVVLDEMGADKLLGNGDMLFLSPGTSMLLRGQGTFLSDDEINNVIEAVSTDQPQFVKELVQLKGKVEETAVPGSLKNRDELYESAVDIVIREGRGSVSLLQRSLGVGYGRAARLIDFMAEDGIVGEYNGSQAREVLLSLDEWEQMNGEEPTPEPAKRPRRSNKILPDPPNMDNDDADDDEKNDGGRRSLASGRGQDQRVSPASEKAPRPGVVALRDAPWEDSEDEDLYKEDEDEGVEEEPEEEEEYEADEYEEEDDLEENDLEENDLEEEGDEDDEEYEDEDDEEYEDEDEDEYEEDEAEDDEYEDDEELEDDELEDDEEWEYEEEEEEEECEDDNNGPKPYRAESA